MSDNAALLLRVSVFGLVAGAVYWFLSYEPLGTVALLLLGVGPGFAGLFIMWHRRGEDRRTGSLPETLRVFAVLPKEDPLWTLPAGRPGGRGASGGRPRRDRRPAPLSYSSGVPGLVGSSEMVS